MKVITTIFSFSLVLSLVAQGTVSLTSAISLQMPSGNGSNGAAVVYHSGTKEYHAAFAGNASFPYAIFDKEGNRKSEKTAEQDIRGMMLIKNEIQINPFSGSNQPDPNSVGTYSTKKKSIVFFDNGKLYYYKIGKTKISVVDLKLSNLKDYNSTSLGYTSKKNMEIVLLNVNKKRLEFYSEKSSKLTASIDLPKNIVVENMFNFSVTNNIAFFFNKKNRIWQGFSINF